MSIANYTPLTVRSGVKDRTSMPWDHCRHRWQGLKLVKCVDQCSKCGQLRLRGGAIFDPRKGIYFNDKLYKKI